MQVAAKSSHSVNCGGIVPKFSHLRAKGGADRKLDREAVRTWSGYDELDT